MLCKYHKPFPQLVYPCTNDLKGVKVVTDEGVAKLHDLISNLPSAKGLGQVLGCLTKPALDSDNHEAVLSRLVNTSKMRHDKNTW